MRSNVRRAENGAVCIYGPGTNFLFGLGSRQGRVAVAASARFGEGAPLAERTAKAAIHETGHALGLIHCRNEGCVMLYSNDLVSFYRKGTSFCAHHRDDLARLGLG
ncbi:MAG: hypothetical protein HY553_03925 [Elusimicrobia bacterium]|nr:hypothetical protein [Elusimicrobiota bacterium]